MPLFEVSRKSHFRRYVGKNITWESIVSSLSINTSDKFRLAKIRESLIESEAERFYFLIALEVFDIVNNNERRFVRKNGQEVIMFECLAFVMSVVTNILNPEEEDYELITNVKFKSIDKFFNMSLLNESDVEDAFISRFGMYDVAQKSTKKESFLITTFTRMLTSINNGVYFSDARYRSQDPLEINFLSVAQKSFSHIYTRLERFVSMIPDRDFD